MFGHNSFVWTPVKVFNAGTEAPAGHTGSFLYVSSQGFSCPSGEIFNYGKLYNEDEMSRYAKLGSPKLLFCSSDLDEAMDYKTVGRTTIR